MLYCYVVVREALLVVVNVLDWFEDLDDESGLSPVELDELNTLLLYHKPDKRLDEAYSIILGSVLESRGEDTGILEAISGLKLPDRLWQRVLKMVESSALTFLHRADLLLRAVICMSHQKYDFSRYLEAVPYYSPIFLI